MASPRASQLSFRASGRGRDCLPHCVGLPGVGKAGRRREDDTWGEPKVTAVSGPEGGAQLAVETAEKDAFQRVVLIDVEIAVSITGPIGSGRSLADLFDLLCELGSSRGWRAEYACWERMRCDLCRTGSNLDRWTSPHCKGLAWMNKGLTPDNVARAVRFFPALRTLFIPTTSTRSAGSKRRGMREKMLILKIATDPATLWGPPNPG